jgi:hypothetical protein
MVETEKKIILQVSSQFSFFPWFFFSLSVVFLLMLQQTLLHSIFSFIQCCLSI